MSPIVRSATREDIPQIAEIYSHWVRTGTATFELEPPSADEMRQRFETVSAAGYPYLVAESHGAIAGYAYASAHRPRRAYRFTVEDSIYIAPDRVRRGVGRVLLERLIADCTARDFRQMVAVIGDSRQMGSIGLHREMGFTFAGVLHSVGYKFDRWVDGVLMQRPLGDGDTSQPAPRRET